MKKYAATVGIDVSKSKLDVRFVLPTKKDDHPHLIVLNNERGIKQIITFLSKRKIELTEVLFCFENAGIYSMPLAIFFSNHNMDYCEVPAIEVKRSKGLVRGKNDKADALDIAFYAITHHHKLKISNLPEADLLRLQLLYSEREKLIKAIHSLERSKEATAFLPKEVLKEMLTINKKSIAALKKSLKEINMLIMKLIKANAEISQNFKLATSVPGVGPQSALYMIVKTRCFTRFTNWRKLACYAGVAPFEYSSGSSIKGRTKVSHLADKKLKALLTMAALSAKRNDKEIGEYFERKVKDGKNKMLVINAIRCKILSRVFAVIERKSPFVNTHKFAA
jgi:transposase